MKANCAYCNEEFDANSIDDEACQKCKDQLFLEQEAKARRKEQGYPVFKSDQDLIDHDDSWIWSLPYNGGMPVVTGYGVGYVIQQGNKIKADWIIEDIPF